MESIVSQYLALVGGWKIVSILVMILLDTLAGIILAIKNKTFVWSKLASFVNSSILMMLGGYLIAGIAVMAEPTIEIALPTVMAAIDAKLLADLVNKLKEFGVKKE